MYSDRVDIFHITYGNAVACTVTHNLVFDFFPACDAALYKYLSDTGQTQTVFKDLFKLCLIVGDTAAGSAKGISRTQYNRISDCVGKGHTVFHVFYNEGCCTRLTDLFHGILEFLTVLCFFDGCGRGAEQGHIV